MISKSQMASLLQTVHSFVRRALQGDIYALTEVSQCRLSSLENKNGGGGENRTRVQRSRETNVLQA